MSRSDRGSATVWVLAAGLVMVSAGALGAAYGSAVVARHRAQVAADLGALAGAARAVFGASAACAEARRIVVANSAALAACQLDGLDLTITAQVNASIGVATATARAGPVRAATARAGPVRGCHAGSGDRFPGSLSAWLRRWSCTSTGSPTGGSERCGKPSSGLVW